MFAMEKKWALPFISNADLFLFYFPNSDNKAMRNMEELQFLRLNGNGSFRREG